MAKEYTSDHDLLIRLDTKVDDLNVKMTALRDDSAGRISKAELRLDNLETRLDSGDKIAAQFGDALELTNFVRAVRSNLKLTVFLGLPVYTALIALLASYLQKILGI